MAKRHHSGDQELPFVALMDTMTNVVGVLTIVLVMMGISLARAAHRILSALPPATEAEVRMALAALDRLRAEQSPLEARRAALAGANVNPAALAALDADAAWLAQKAKETGAKSVDPGALEREMAKRAAELKQKKDAANALMAERERLKALLDKPAERKDPPAKVVRIPASRPIPQKAQVEHFLVTKEDVYWIDDDGVKRVFLNALKSSAVRALVDKQMKRGDRNVVILDHEKLVRYFEKRLTRYHEFRYEILFANWTTSPILRLVPNGAPSVPLANTLRRIKRQPDAVVLFHVTADAFENYLAAREVCDSVGVPAGWEFSGEPAYRIIVREIETNYPQAPASPPKAPSANEIKPPSQKLD